MSSQNYAHSDDMYFDDGNVVIEAQGTVFRIYRGILARNSTVFADMFAFPQPPTEGTDVYDGCPLVHISDDANHMKIFLQAIHDPNFYLHEVPTPYSTVAAILRLSSKYDVQYLRERAIRQLDHHFPSTAVSFISMTKSKHDGTFSPLVLHIDLFSLADVARETGSLHLLPVIFWYLCREPLGALLLHPMSEVNRHACLVGRDDFKSRFVAEYVGPVARLSWETCTMHGQCASRLLDRLCDTTALQNAEVTMLCVSKNRSTCRECDSKLSALTLPLARNTWRDLPTMFGLPSWEELLKDRT